MYSHNIRFYIQGSVGIFVELIERAYVREDVNISFVESADLADIIGLEYTTQGELEVISRIKRSYAEVMIYAHSSKPFNPFYRDDVLLLLDDSMYQEELVFRFKNYIRSFLERLELDQTTQYLDTLINSVPNLVWYKTKDGVHVKVNDFFCEVVGKPREDVLGKRHAYIWDVEADDPACIATENMVMDSRKTVTAEEVVSLSDGSKMILTTYKSPIYARDGSTIGTVGIGINITREREVMQTLESRNHTLENLFLHMGCGVLCYTVDGLEITNVNESALKILGYNSKEEIEADGFTGIAKSVVDEDRSALSESINTLVHEGDSVSVEYRVRHKDGKLLFVMGDVKLVNLDGRLQYQRYLLDCTKQRAEEKRAEEFNKGMINALSTDYAIVCYFDLTNGKGKLISVDKIYDKGANSELRDDFDLDDFADILSSYIHSDDFSEMDELLNLKSLHDYFVNNQSLSHNFRASINDMEVFLRIRAERVKRAEVESEAEAEAEVEAEAEWGVAVGIQDVDTETRLDMGRTIELRTALAQARVASDTKSKFLSDMTHDLRTPMNAIINFTSLAMKNIDNRVKASGYLSKVMVSSEHLLDLVNNVLDMSKIESGHMQLDIHSCWLPDLVRRVGNLVISDAKNRNINLSIDAFGLTHEHIYCDSLRLQQILANIITNAVKYTKENGKVVLTVREVGAKDEKVKYQFIVEDTGIGMTPEFLARIFDSFEREGNTTVSGIQGTGLGMAITKNLVDMMQGDIKITSQKNVGTKVVVDLTFDVDTDYAVIDKIEELVGERALIIDDDYSVCDNVDQMLTTFGMSVDWTMTGAEVDLRVDHAVSRNRDYRLYVVDYILPDMSGLDVVKKLRSRIGDESYILLLTSYDLKAIEKDAKKAGVSALCSKPVFISELGRVLKSLVAPHENDVCKEVIQPSSGGKKSRDRILLVEDNELNREIALELLSDIDDLIIVDIACDGEEAFNKIAESEPGYYALVLMDIQMPVMDGYTATKSIRNLSDSTKAGVPIYAMTANAFEEDRKKAIDMGMNGHIPKPIDPDLLISTILAVLNKEMI